MTIDPTRLEQLFGVARRIWDERGDLRDRFGQVEALGYWRWLLADGIEEYAEVCDLIPHPPPDLVGRVVGSDPTGRFFRESGIDDAAGIHASLVEGGFDFARPASLLDFGCGCGRLLRVFARFADTCRLFGADPDRAAIDWCRENLDYASFEVSDPKPPSPFADGQFDGVYAYSVFTHLPEDLHRDWLEELRRITAPGGVVVLTTAGRRRVEMMLAGEGPQTEFPGPARLRADLPQLEQRGYLYYSYEFETPGMPAEVAAEGLHGRAFILEHYLRDHWRDLFEIVAFHDAPYGWQDYVVLRRR